MSLRYVHVNQDGAISIREAADYRTALADVGPEGWDHVRLQPSNLAGFVNDCGHVLTETYRRNVVGSLLLMAFGATVLPYAGPIVVTGWNSDRFAEGVEVRGLDDMQISVVRDMGNVIRAALHMPAEPACDACAPLLDDENWVAITQEMAEAVRTTPTPTLTITPGFWTGAS